MPTDAPRSSSLWSLLSEGRAAVLDLLGPEAVTAAVEAIAALGPAPDDGCVAASRSGTSRCEPWAQLAAELASGALAPLGGAIAGAMVTDPELQITWPGPASGHGLGSADDDAPTVLLALDWLGPETGAPWVVATWSDDEHLEPSTAVPVALAPGQVAVLPGGGRWFSLPNVDRPARAIIGRLVGVPDGPSATVAEAELREVVKEAIEAPTTPHGATAWCGRCGTPLLGHGPHAWRAAPPRWCDACEDEPITWRRAPDAPLPQVRPAATTRVEPGLPVLVDRALDAQLERDGFVVVPEPVIAPDVATELRTRFGELHQWRGEGHLNDFNHRDLRYRAEANRLMREVLGEALGALFVDHEPFLTTFLCKWPGDDSALEPHQDWSYIDEDRGEQTFAAFVALNPIDGHNGQIRVLRGSHRVDGRPRGTHLRTPWIDRDEVVEPRLESLPMAIGQCAIWNSATVHSSYHNATADPRVAATLWFARRSATHVHYRRWDERTARRYDIDPWFYERLNPYWLMVAEPPYPVSRVVEVDDADQLGDQLGPTLDRLAGRRGPRAAARRVKRALRPGG
ncbi:MAG: phytanoyl-CoA dioxygenase family protein [Acidimicrobiales bacterium]